MSPAQILMSRSQTRTASVQGTHQSEQGGADRIRAAALEPLPFSGEISASILSPSAPVQRVLPMLMLMLLMLMLLVFMLLMLVLMDILMLVLFVFMLLVLMLMMLMLMLLVLCF